MDDLDIPTDDDWANWREANEYLNEADLDDEDVAQLAQEAATSAGRERGFYPTTGPNQAWSR
jgi:hypothetical protein